LTFEARVVGTLNNTAEFMVLSVGASPQGRMPPPGCAAVRFALFP
jgi:hypothetical protein